MYARIGQRGLRGAGTTAGAGLRFAGVVRGGVQASQQWCSSSHPPHLPWAPPPQLPCPGGPLPPLPPSSPPPPHPLPHPPSSPTPAAATATPSFLPCPDDPHRRSLLPLHAALAGAAAAGSRGAAAAAGRNLAPPGTAPQPELPWPPSRGSGEERERAGKKERNKREKKN